MNSDVWMDQGLPHGEFCMQQRLCCCSSHHSGDQLIVDTGVHNRDGMRLQECHHGADGGLVAHEFAKVSVCQMLQA